jgi:hypothetical protein
MARAVGRTDELMTDAELTDAWLAGTRFPGGISHDQHMRIAWVLHRRHGPERAEELLVAGTRRACQVHGSPEKFDEALTRRWSRAVAKAAERGGLGTSAAAFIDAHPELRRTDRFSRPDVRRIRAR